MQMCESVVFFFIAMVVLEVQTFGVKAVMVRTQLKTLKWYYKTNMQCLCSLESYVTTLLGF